jgi:predicted small lipoprotein YifL
MLSMTGIRGGLTALAVLLCVAGCTSYGPSPVPPASDASAVTDPTVAASAPVWSQAGIQEAVPVTAAPGNTKLPWKFVALSADGRKIQVIYVAGGGCTTFVGFVVTETTSTVTLTATGDTDLTQKACAANAKTGAGTVTLDGPLASRALWHGPVSDQWVVVARVLEGG